MTRHEMLQALERQAGPWDILVIGGGATGLGVAVDAATRGYRTLLLEQHDFAKGTSSRSTKLIHGGVRYLQQGNVSLVLEALRERGLLTQNAPHLVSHLSFIVPNYTWWEAPFYGVGLKIYDLLAGKLGLGPSRHLSREETLQHLPTLEPQGLRGGTIYYDGQFDDARLAVTLARILRGWRNRQTEGVAGGNAPLLHRGRSKAGKADDVARRVYMFHIGLKCLGIDVDPSALVDIQTAILQSQLGRRSHAARAVE
jgi:glycerol-3-phosphate dehydrogenase